MRKMRTNKGFTLVEALFVVAIIVVLGSVVILSVVDYLRSMTKTEYDGYAKTVFVAAQNHLTMAEHEGYLGRKNFGRSDEQAGVYYFVVQNGVSIDYEEEKEDNSVRDLILPFGSVDETIRAGSYIIRYQKSSAKVLDVFYWNTEGRYAFNYGVGEGTDLAGLLAAKAEDEDNLRNFVDGSVIGYYGGTDKDLEPGDPMIAPQIKVVNAERLYVDVTKTTTDVNQKTNVIIHGETSDAVRIMVISNENEEYLDGDHYHIVLDDVTADTKNNYHFSKINTDSIHWSGSGDLIPGENITIQAVVYNENVYTNVAYSTMQKTNSLFADYYENKVDDDKVYYTFVISNIRHLENLDRRISNLGAYATDEHPLPFDSAEQTTDLSWTEFTNAIDLLNAEKVAVLDMDGVSSTVAGKGGFEPISPNYALSYNGNGHIISDVVIDVMGKAGIFGAPEAMVSVSNLKLQNFTVSANGSAGTLAGSLSAESKVRNVVAYQGKGAAESRVTSTDGNAGGLIGDMQSSVVEGCAASVYVTSANGNAGGLIGRCVGGSVLGSYSGGHTKGGAYVTVFDTELGYTSEQPLVNNAFNVIAPLGSAGGLIGQSDSTIQYCYSTCSADGKVAGGLVGTAKVTTGVGLTDRAIKDNYCTGLVRGTQKGAFIGQMSGEGVVSGNYYFSIINWGVPSVYELSDHAEASGIFAFDTKTADYQNFVSTGKTNNPAAPYDDTLVAYYQGKFNLKTVKQLGYMGDEELDADDEEDGEDDEFDEDETKMKDFVDTHYGDWPAPEILIVNVPDAD